MDLSSIDFTSMSRAEIVSALVDAADGGPAEFADVDDNRGRLATEADNADAS